MTWVLGALAVLQFVLYLRDRRKREVTYSLGGQQLYSRSGLESDQIGLELNDSPMRELFMTELEVINTGNETLKEDDFIRPFTVTWTQDVRLFPLEIVRDRTDVDLSFDVDRGSPTPSIVVSTPVFEPRDRISLRALYEAEDEARVEFDCRLVNATVESRHVNRSLAEDYKAKLANTKRFSWHEYWTLMVAFSVFAILVAGVWKLLNPFTAGVSWEGGLRLLGGILVTAILGLGFLFAMYLFSRRLQTGHDVQFSRIPLESRTHPSTTGEGSAWESDERA